MKTNEKICTYTGGKEAKTIVTSFVEVAKDPKVDLATVVHGLKAA